MSGGPVSVKWASANLPAMLAAWYPGEEAGTALAKVLFGEYNPARRLPYTVYDSVDQIPSQDEYDITKGFYLHVFHWPSTACLWTRPELHRVPLHRAEDYTRPDLS
jgi:beta-glucosidase